MISRDIVINNTYTLAKDHRTGYEMGNIQAVMDGDIDGFLNAYLQKQSLDALNAE